MVTSPANHTALLATPPEEIKKTCLILTCSMLVQPRINALVFLDVNHVQLENWAAYSRASSLQDNGYTRTVPGLVQLYTERASLCRLARGSAGAQPCPLVHSSTGPQAAWKAAVSVQGQDACTQRSLVQTGTRISHTTQTGNLLLPLESMYVIVSYTTYKSLVFYMNYICRHMNACA